MRLKSSLKTVFGTFIVLMSLTPTAHAASPCPSHTSLLIKLVPRSPAQNQLSAEFERLEKTLNHLTEDGSVSSGEGSKVVMAAIELGNIKGLKNLAGKPLNLSAGGVSAVMNDIAEYYPKLLAGQKNGKLTIVGVLMDGMDKTQMVHARNIKINVEGNLWDVGVYEYQSPQGAKYVFLENPSFNRFTAMPDAAVKEQSVYTMRGLEKGSPKDKLEEQKIWSAINQSVAEVTEHERADIYVPHDSHMSPASFYIHRNQKIAPISVKPLIHNEGYVGNYTVQNNSWDQVKKIWNLKDHEMNDYFMHGDQLIMMAPAVRVAERNEVYTGLSVSKGTADGINGAGKARIKTQIEFFDRVGELTNGLGDESRPHLTQLLKKGTPEEIAADGIKNPKVAKKFANEGYSFTEKGSSKQILAEKAESKEAFQLEMGLEVDPKKPLYVSFARLVHQKGMGFVAENVEHILASGGQIVVGGPVGDAIGAADAELFRQIKAKLLAEGNANARNFVFIDGPVKGRVKGLMLAGGDFFLIPSRYEPCGLTDCEALFNGTIPIAHDVGGLNKGEQTILYRAGNVDAQGWELGQAINESFQRYQDQPTFQKSQIAAMAQDFSLEKNFSKFLSNQRIEVYGKMLREIQGLADAGTISQTQAIQLIQEKIVQNHASDVPALRSALKMMHPSRRNAMMEWIIAKGTP
jgi:glycosyltransferase involved in cell wall biosynthesis